MSNQSNFNHIEEQIRKAIHEVVQRGLADREELLAIASRRRARCHRTLEKTHDRETE